MDFVPRFLSLVMLTTVLLACSTGAQHGAGHPSPDPVPMVADGGLTSPAASDASATDAPSASMTTDSTRAPNPSREECERWVDHFIVLAAREQAKGLSEDQIPTAEQIAQIRADMAPQLLPACMTLARSTFECQMKAHDRDGLVVCSNEAERNAPNR